MRLFGAVYSCSVRKQSAQGPLLNWNSSRSRVPFGGGGITTTFAASTSWEANSRRLAVIVVTTASARRATRSRTSTLMLGRRSEHGVSNHDRPHGEPVKQAKDIFAVGSTLDLVVRVVSS
jgi:hypothetical protein